MSRKREEAQRAAAARAAAEEQAKERDVVPWLRALGFRADEARRAASACETIPDASLEERVRLALSCLGPPHRRVVNGLGRPA
jgi:Holliday junction resolvasome RuvABC DNA-binding subunit